MENVKKILLICNNQSNQKALANKLFERGVLSNIAVIQFQMPKKTGFIHKALSFKQKIASISIGLPFRIAWFAMLNYYEKNYPNFPITPFLTDNVNSLELLNYIEEIRPDLVLISGTNLLKDSSISRINQLAKIMNLHTGISPYVKGGPNCTNWCLSTGNFDYIGNTIMWIDKGIDSGHIISTERTPLSGKESLSQLHINVMEHAHDLYIRSVLYFNTGATLPNINQNEIDKGNLYLSKQWTFNKMLLGLINFVFKFNPNSVLLKKPRKIRLINLDTSIK